MIALINRSPLDVDESLETLRQNIDMLNTLIALKTPLTLADKDKPFASAMNFQVGQWIDIKDSIDQWLEGQIIEIRAGKAFVHYNGWGNRWDEWIDLTSPRIALFRSHTIQMSTNKYTSPTPNIKPDAENFPVQQTNTNEVLGQTSNLLDKLRNMTELYLNLARHEEQLRRITMVEESKRGSMEERRKQQMAAQLAPLMDRLGRLLIDLSPHLYSTAYTEAEQAEERKAERSCKVPPMDNPKDIAIVTNVIDRLLFTEAPRIELHIHASLSQQAMNIQPRNAPQEANRSTRAEATIQTEETKKNDARVGTELKCRDAQMQTEFHEEPFIIPSAVQNSNMQRTTIIKPITNTEKVTTPIIAKQTMKRKIIRNSMNPKRRKTNTLETRVINPIVKQRTTNPTRIPK